MEKEKTVDLKNRIEQAVINIENLAKETLSFSETRKELLEITEQFKTMTKNLETMLSSLDDLNNEVTELTVEKTFDRFEANTNVIMKTLEKMHQKLNDDVSMKLLKFQKRTIVTFIAFGLSSVIILLLSVLFLN